MKLGISAFAWTSSFGIKHLPLLPRVREYGFTGFEIPMFHPRDLPVVHLRSSFESSGLECTVCAILPPEINPIHADRSIQKRSLVHLIECVEVAAEMGARLLCGPVYAPIGYIPKRRRTEDERKRAVEIFQCLGEKLDEHKMTLSIEPVNRSETSFLKTVDQAQQLCAAIHHPRVGITVDTFHANIEEKCIVSAIERIGPQLCHLHLSENDRGLLGTGHIPFPDIFQALQKIEYEGSAVIEGFGFSRDEPDSPGAFLADQNVSPEDIALFGLEYLHSLGYKHRNPAAR